MNSSWRHALAFAAAVWGTISVALTPFVQAAHECILYQYLVPEIPLSEYHYIELGEDDMGLVDGSLSEEEYQERLGEVLAESTAIEYTEFQTELAGLASVLVDGIAPPLGPDGKPLPPPMKLPSGPEGQPNPWKPRPGSLDRPIKWVPTIRVPSPDGGQPDGSWDPDLGHWDMHSGLGQTVRQLPDGTPVDHDNNPICDPDPPPAPFVDWNFDVLLMGAAVVVAVVIIAIIASPAIGAVAATIAITAAIA